MRFAEPSCYSEVAATISRAGHFVSGMLKTDLASSPCVGFTPVRCADPVRTVLGADGRPCIARRVATWLTAETSDSAVQMAVATVLLCIRCAVFYFTLAECSMNEAQTSCLCFRGAAFNRAWFPAVFGAEPSASSLAWAAIH